MKQLNYILYVLFEKAEKDKEYFKKSSSIVIWMLASPPPNALSSPRADPQLSGKLGYPVQLILWDLWCSYIHVEYNLCVCVIA